MLYQIRISVQINSFVANYIAEFSDRHRMFYRRVGMDRFYLLQILRYLIS